MTPEFSLAALAELQPVLVVGASVCVRSAVGMGSLPCGIAVEIEALFELA